MSNGYAVIENSLVVNVVASDAAYAQTQGWVLLTGSAGIGWSYIDGQFTPPENPAPTPEQIQAQNKNTAVYLLQETDWTATVYINNPEYSNPYLANQDEFFAWRSQIRAVAINPPSIPVTFPVKPEEIWVTA